MNFMTGHFHPHQIAVELNRKAAIDKTLSAQEGSLFQTKADPNRCGGEPRGQLGSSMEELEVRKVTHFS
jgi:hypothetical protein